MHIYPSLISSPLLKLEHTLTEFNSLCNGYHIDIMDDHFVPNLTWGAAFTNAIKQATTLPLHVHLMVSNPEIWIDRLKLNEYDYFIFHREAVTAQVLTELIKKIKEASWQVGIAINPETSIESIEPWLNNINLILVMTVNPGFSGQKFIPTIYTKIEQLCMLRQQKSLSFEVSVDGGVNLSNIAQLSQLGVNSVAAASALFYTDNPTQSLHDLYEKAQQ